jgi:hypothetical protein
MGKIKTNFFGAGDSERQLQYIAVHLLLPGNAGLFT